MSSVIVTESEISTMSEMNFDSNISSSSESFHVNNHTNHTNGLKNEDQERRNSEPCSEETKPEGKVLVLYTGGTIGMIRNKNGALIPIANAFVKNLRKYPNLHDKEYAEARFGPMGPLVLPMTDTCIRRIIYDVREYMPLCDSSNMRMDDWIKIAQDIKESYEHFDGFVILHGTDTLSYTASALSFMLEALGKIVILTGSQVPIFDTRSDGLDNFVTSLVIAANYNIPEVCIFFGTRLMRGNRTTKSSVTAFEAFHSPNAAPLAVAGIKINVDFRSIFRTCLMEKFHVHTTLNKNVGLLRLFPSITAELIKAFCLNLEGVVLQTYGAGNIPSNREDILHELKSATKCGVIIVNITQCPEGSVSTLYEAGKVLEDSGVISGFDMTPEAALTKLAYVLSKSEWDTKTKRSMMETSLRGELTAGRSIALQDWDLVHAVGRSLRISSPVEFKELGSILFPAMLNAAVMAKDTPKLTSLMGYGADISQTNADNRTALHIACCEGDIAVVRHLLKMGANVHIKDRFNRTSLTDAIEHDHYEIIKLLRQCGAHLHERACTIGERLCAAAAVGNKNRLISYHMAGADLSQPDISGRTALHLAALHGHATVVQLLMQFGADPKVRDMLQQTAVDVAQQSEIKKLIADSIKL